MTACLLILSSLAALSNSSSMDAVKSTLTRWMGFIIRPELVKNRETSRPLSAIRAMLSADAGFFLPRMVVIEFSFFPGCLPQGHQMVELSFRIFPNLINHRVQALTYLANGAMLNREVRTLVGVVGMKENLLHFLEADSAPRVCRRLLLFPLIEVESHKV